MRCGGRGDVGRMRREQHRDPGLGVELAEQLDHAPAVFRIEVAGRFVGDEQRRAVDERAGNRAALQLAARELRRVVREPLGEPDALQQRPRRAAPRRGALAAEQQRQLDVLERASASAAG